MKSRRQRVELLILAICFLLAFMLNVVAIMLYHTSWKELYSQWIAVILLSLFLYALTWIIRFIFWGVKAAWSKISKRKK